MILSATVRGFYGTKAKSRREDVIFLIMSSMVCAASAYLLLTLVSISATYIHGERLILPLAVLEAVNAVFYGGAYLAGLAWATKRLKTRKRLVRHLHVVDVWLSMVLLDTLVLSVLEGRFMLAEIFLVPILLAVLLPIIWCRRHGP